MPAAVYRPLHLLCRLVAGCPRGTNLGLLHLLGLLGSGRRLAARGAVVPGLAACGLSDRAVRRAWAALGPGGGASGPRLARWAAAVAAAGRWQPQAHGGSHPVAVDVTGFWRPRLRGGPTTHDHAEAGKALPAIPGGLIARVGRVGAQRLARPLALVRAAPADPSPRAPERRLGRAAVRRCAPTAVLVLEGGCGRALLPEDGATRSVVRLAKNATFRRALPPPYGGRGRPPTRGAVVRPLPRRHTGRPIPATPPDRVATWAEAGHLLRAEVWADLALPDADTDGPAVTVVAIHDPRHREPLLLATALALTPQQARDGSRDRWPVEQLPLAAKPLRGAARQFVHAPATGQRRPALALLAGAVLSYAAATAPASPTGCWDRCPRATPGRVRRLLARTPVPQDFPLPARLREKAAVTDHRPKGVWGQRRPPADLPAVPAPDTLVVAA